MSTEPVSLKTLLVEMPPNRIVRLDMGCINTTGLHPFIVLEDIELWCDDERCGRTMYFEALARRDTTLSWGETTNHFLSYRCKHCEQSQKTYALKILTGEEPHGALAVKLGEFPSFGKPIPTAINKLIDASDRAWLLKGLRSEELGFGVGAFGYFRRVIEGQWARLLQRMIEVASKTQSDQSLIDHLRKAAAEQQFSKSIEMAKAAIPPALFVDGHNPISLLHSALSEGLHAAEDDHCLELATSIREVLYALSARMANALKNEASLNEALGRLHQRRNVKSTGGNVAPGPQPAK